MRDQRAGVLIELNPLNHCLVDPEQNPPYADITHAASPDHRSCCLRTAQNLCRKRRATHSDAHTHPQMRQERRKSALNRLMLWSALHQSGDEGAMDLLRHAVADLEELARRDPGDMEVHEWLAGAHGDLGKWSASTDRLDCAATHLTRSVALAQMLVDLDPGKHETLLVGALRLLSEVWTRLGREAEASEASARADEVERGHPDSGDDL